MGDPKTPRSKSALTQEEFNELLRRLSSQPIEAAEKYEELRWKLMQFFEWSGCEDAEQLTDETFDRVAQKLIKRGDEIQSVEAFAWGVAKRIRQEGQRNDLRKIHLAEAPSHVLADAGESFEQIHRKLQSQKEIRCLRKCLAKLPSAEQELFLAYRMDKAYYAENRRQLATNLGLTPAALRVRVVRTRDKLQKCVINCLQVKPAGLHPG